ncbi:ribosome recycling factor [Candidatus Saccharibacteria bacterium]|nr:MAG: ribosome recycling factor [Candidatus Saccharibacteria bacterium]
MNPQSVVDETKKKFAGAVEHYHEQLKSLRTGRASAAMLDGVIVEAYGTPMPLNQVANVIAPEAQLLQITPFDPSNLQAIASAIRDNPSLGLNPSDDGRVVRVPIPALTEERRREIVKQLGSKQEDAMIAVRNIRHEAMDAIDSAKKDKSIGEDDAKRLSTQVEDAMQKTRADIETASKAKESDILSL